MRIAFIGSGSMGEAMISAVLGQGAFAPDTICACDIDQTRLTTIGGKYKVRCTSDVGSALSDSKVVVLSIKPQVLAKVMKDLKGKLSEGQLVLSIVAGAKLDTIVKGLGHDQVVRVMPNTPAQVGEGMSVWTATSAVSQEQKDAVQTILKAMGKEIYFPEEKYIDMATAISGSGPAYIFLIMEALIDSAVHIGLPRETAVELVTQTVLGSARIADESGKHLAQLRNMVTSPGGTTAEGLQCLEEGGMRAIIAQAVIAAYEKAKLLGGDDAK
jgi:pyrroline-5-carboxylate reductase